LIEQDVFEQFSWWYIWRDAIIKQHLRLLLDWGQNILINESSNIRWPFVNFHLTALVCFRLISLRKSQQQKTHEFVAFKSQIWPFVVWILYSLDVWRKILASVKPSESFTSVVCKYESSTSTVFQTKRFLKNVSTTLPPSGVRIA